MSEKMNILVRNIDPNIHAQLKNIAEKNGTSLQEMMLDLIENIVLRDKIYDSETRYKKLVNQLMERLDINAEIILKAKESIDRCNLLLEDYSDD